MQAIMIVIMAVVVMLQELVRLGLLDLLIVIAPLALLVERLVQLWLAVFVAVLAMQLLQATAVALGAALIAQLGGNLSIVSTLAGIAILLLVLKIPRWLGTVVNGAVGGVDSPFGYAAHAARDAGRAILLMLRVTHI